MATNFLFFSANDSESEDDDEEAQLSSRDSERSFGSSPEENSGSIPSVVEIGLPSLSIDARAGDIQMISTIIGEINDPMIKSALESIVKDPGHASPSRCLSSNEWTPIDILYDGLMFAGFPLERLQKNNIRRKTEWFKAFFGVEHTTVAPYLADLRKDNPDVNFKDCLMAMNWLTCYDTYPVLSARWQRCEEYIGSKVIEYGFKMAALARKKIKLELAHDVEIGWSVDCFTCMAREMRLDPSSEWFDWKTHSCGLVR